MAEDNNCIITSAAFHIDKIGVGCRNKSFELMGLSFGLEDGVKEVTVHCLLRIRNSYIRKHKQTVFNIIIL